MNRNVLMVGALALLLSACGSSAVKKGTLEELRSVDADLEDVYLDRRLAVQCAE